jgi:hypothetical protein
MSFRLRSVRLRLELVQACSPCPPGGECEGKLRRPFPRRGISQQLLAPCDSPKQRSQPRRGQGTHSVGFRRRATDPAAPCFRSSSATPHTHALVARRRSSVSQATSTRGVPTKETSKQRTCRGRPHAAADLQASSRWMQQRHFSCGFGCRCGACDVDYYGLWGKCRACGSQALVFFLSRAVPALGTLAVTSFFFWGGVLALPRHRCCLSIWCLLSVLHGP